HLSAEWRVILREETSYIREELLLRAVGGDVQIKEIVLLDEKIPGVKTIGAVDGSPAAAGNFFFGYEHPMAQNMATNGTLRSSFVRNAVLKNGETLAQSCVLGVVSKGQLRRGFLAYTETERAHPYRPFLQYNSWYDIHSYTEAQCVDAINQLGHQLVQERGVAISSFLFDDGWDDHQTLWHFRSNSLPRGFTPLQQAAASYNSALGVWISPFGGYGKPKQQRLESGSAAGFETNASGFSLAGTNYYRRFHDICADMIQKYGINQFKFDGLAAGARAGADGLTRDGDAMLRMIASLRSLEPDLYINQTVGTWPSPFWLLHVDSTWRGNSDHAFFGKGSPRQQWITYRDMITFKNVVQRAPLYPLNSLMLHGIIYGRMAPRLNTTDDKDFADEVREFFGCGTQVQELYLTPSLLNQQNWDDLAEAARWSQANSRVLVDTHWIGGDPHNGEVYGWASWSPVKCILVLRNPGDQPATFSGDPASWLELPAGARGAWRMHSPWKQDAQSPATELRAGQAHTFELQPFQVLVLESI